MIVFMKKKYLYWVVLCFFAGVTAGCNSAPDPQYLKNGKQYGEVRGLFRQRWWNFYERGLSFSEGGFWLEASDDFSQAISQRTVDQRRVRTYGMHFFDYFPHRDLGVAYYHLEKYVEAEKELKKSLSDVDTAKAKFYLNRVRQAILKGAGSDTSAPVINILSAVDGQLTNQHCIVLKGLVEDDFYVDRILVDNEPQFIELAAEKINFSNPARLKKGINEITVKACDLLGKCSEKRIKIIADFEGPVLNFRGFSDGQNCKSSSVMLKGVVADAVGLRSLRVANKYFQYNNKKESEFLIPVSLEKGKNAVKFSALDTAGNVTEGQINLFYNCSDRDKHFSDASHNDPIRIAFTGSGMLDTGQHRLFAVSGRRAALNPFRLDLKDIVDFQAVYYDSIYIDGNVTGTKKVATVRINGQPVFIIPGRTIYFNQLVELQKGKNLISIEARDVSGNSVSRTITVERKIPAIHCAGSRMSIAVLPFEIKGDVTPLSTVVYDNIVSAFLKQKRFNVVSRGAELEAVLRELKLAATSLVDKQTAVRVGKIVAAEAVLTGSVHETKDSIEIYARLIDTESSGVLDARDVYGQGKSMALLNYITNGLALKFKLGFPLIEGMVIKIAGDKVYADFGSNSQIKKQMKFIVFRKGEPIVHPVTGRLLGAETQQLGVARIVKVFDEFSVGELEQSSEGVKIKVKDFIITK